MTMSHVKLCVKILPDMISSTFSTVTLKFRLIFKTNVSDRRNRCVY